MEIKIPFNDRFRDAMLSGRKTVTSRTRWYGKVGDTFEVFGRKFIIRERFNCRLDDVITDYLSEEGFASPGDFIEFWQKLHPRRGYNPDQIVCVHKFSLMSSNKVWAMCIDCEAELKQSDKQCPRCGSTKKSYKREASVGIGIKVVETIVTQKRKGYHRFMKKMISRWKRSGDPRLTEGVHERLTMDKEKDERHQVVEDEKTGDVIHEEHEPLSQHKNQPKHLEG